MRIKVTMHMDVPVGFSAAAYGSAISCVRNALARCGLFTSVWHIEYIDPPPPHAVAINCDGPTGKAS